MNNEFDELAKNMAQSVTRRGALKKFGFGLAGIALASLGLANKAEGGKGGCQCERPYYGCHVGSRWFDRCLTHCSVTCNP